MFKQKLDPKRIPGAIYDILNLIDTPEFEENDSCDMHRSKGGSMFISVVENLRGKPAYSHRKDAKANVLWIKVRVNTEKVSMSDDDGTPLFSEPDTPKIQFLVNSQKTASASLDLKPHFRNRKQYPFDLKEIELALDHACKAAIRTRERENGPGHLTRDLVSRLHVMDCEDDAIDRLPLTKIEESVRRKLSVRHKMLMRHMREFSDRPYRPSDLPGLAAFKRFKVGLHAYRKDLEELEDLGLVTWFLGRGKKSKREKSGRKLTRRGMKISAYC